MGHRGWFVRLYGEIIHELLARGLSPVQADEICSMIPSVDIARYGVSCAKDLSI